MKWIALLALLVLTPILASVFRDNRRYLLWGAFAIGLLPFLIDPLNLNADLIAWPDWPGAVRGIEITLLDAVAIAVLSASRHRTRTPLSMKLALGVYVAGFLISTLVTPVKWPAVFYGWQLLKAVLVYFAVARGGATEARFAPNVISGAIAGLLLQAGVATAQYLGGTAQAGGLLGHQNLLGMAAHFALYPAFALFLAGFYTNRTGLGVISGLAVAFTGGSRATIGLMVLGLALTVALSLWCRVTSRKLALATSTAAILLIASPVFFAAVERRPMAAREESNQLRASMVRAARMIIADHPLGVGANRYVIVANTGGYSSRAGVPWNYDNRRAPVHNTYYLTAAEMGWLGLLGVISLIASMVVIGVATVRKIERRLESEMIVGLTVSVLVVSIHMLYEWIIMLSSLHYLLAMNCGLIVGIRAYAQSNANIRQLRKNRTHLPSSIAVE